MSSTATRYGIVPPDGRATSRIDRYSRLSTSIETPSSPSDKGFDHRLGDYACATLFLGHLIRMAANVDICKACLPPLLLFLDPRADPNGNHALAIGQQGGISLRQLRYPTTGILAALDADIDAPAQRTLPDATEGGSGALAASRASLIGMAQAGQEAPEFVESRNLTGPVLVPFGAHRIPQRSSLAGNACPLSAETAVETTIGHQLQVRHVALPAVVSAGLAGVS